MCSVTHHASFHSVHWEQILLNAIGLNLGWVYLFMGVMIGSAVIPLWNMMTWKDASGKGAVIAAWGGLVLAIAGWLIALLVLYSALALWRLHSKKGTEGIKS